jgi:hypothetical protein
LLGDEGKECPPPGAESQRAGEGRERSGVEAPREPGVDGPAIYEAGLCGAQRPPARILYTSAELTEGWYFGLWERT